MAYSNHNPTVGYTQGMNYLAGLILIGVDMNEELAFKVFVALMEKSSHNLQMLYER